jgi:high-affinity iron transporter
MIESFVIALREGIEAALIVGIILGYLKKVGAETLAKPVYYGVGLGVLASIGVAGFFLLLRVEFEGKFEQLFEGITMLVAAVILTTMILWMRNNSKTYSEDLREKVETALTKRQSYGLASLAFVSIWREGIETVLFLGSASFTSSGIQLLIGGGLGLGLAVLIGVAIVKYSVRLNLRTFFNVTGILLILFAAGLVGRSVLEFQEVGAIAPVVDHVYNINWLIDNQSTAGKLLTALFGYDASPSLAEIFGYVGYWILISFWMYRDAISNLSDRVVGFFRPA